MSEFDIISLVQSVAFPIVVSLWFMFRVEKILKDHSEVCRSHAELVRELIMTLEKRGIK